jgi:hypothetical protein
VLDYFIWGLFTFDCDRQLLPQFQLTAALLVVAENLVPFVFDRLAILGSLGTASKRAWTWEPSVSEKKIPRRRLGWYV